MDMLAEQQYRHGCLYYTDATPCCLASKLNDESGGLMRGYNH